MAWARDPTAEGTLEQTERDRRAWDEGTHMNFAITGKTDGRVLGVVGLNREGDGAELHYWIRSDHAGLGLTTEACRALVAWAQGELKLPRLTLWAGRENLASRRVAQKLGFRHVGKLDWRPEGGIGSFDAESYELAFES